MAGCASKTLDLSPSKEQDKQFRVARLLIQLGTRILRSYFDTCHPPEWLAHNLSNWKTHLNRNWSFSRNKILLYPDSGDPDSKDFDFTLLYQLLREICGLNEPSCKWDGFPSRDDTSIESDITRLRFYRNTCYGHVLDDMAIPSDEFDKIWEDIAQAILRINDKCAKKIDRQILEDQIWRLKYGPLTHDEKDVLIKKIMEVQKVQGEALCRLECQGSDISKRVENNQETLRDHSETLCRIECKEDDLCKQVEQIQCTLTASASKPDPVTMNATTKNDNITQTNYFINHINNISINNNAPNLNISGNDIANNPILRNLQNVLMPDQQALQRNSALPQSLSSSQISSRSNNPNNQYQHSTSYPLGHPTWDATATASFSEHQRSFDKASIPHSWSEGNIGDITDNSGCFGRDNYRSAVDLSSSPAQASLSHTTHDESPTATSPCSDTAQPNSSRESVTSSHSSTDMRRWSSEYGMFPPPEPPDGVQLCSTPTIKRFNSQSQVKPSDSQNNLRGRSIDDSAFFSFEPSEYVQGNTSPTSCPQVLQINSSNLNVKAKPFSPTSSSTPSLPMFQIDAQKTQCPNPSENKNLVLGEPLAQGPMSCTSAAMSLGFSHDESSKQSRSDAPQSEPILNIYIRQVIEDPTKEQQNDFHLGHYINQSTMSQGSRDDDQFRNYFEEQKIKIAKVDFKEEDKTSCLMSVRGESLRSLSNFWKDYQSSDLREIIRALLPVENVGIEINIDHKQYEQCCEMMRQTDGGEQVTLSRSFNQSLSVDQASPERHDPYIQRSFSLGDLPRQKVFDKLFTLLCIRGGKMHYSDIEKSLPTNEWTEIKKALPKMMSIDKRIRVLPGNILQATMDFCPRSYGECDVRCPQLHVCRYFLLGMCTFLNCKNSHDISDRQTNMIFQKANLVSLPEEGRHALLKSFACKIPSICKFYNKGSKSECKKNDDCHCLHVCKYWIQGRCLFSKHSGKKCNRAHTFADSATQKILQECNLHELDDDELKEKLSKNIK